MSEPREITEQAVEAAVDAALAAIAAAGDSAALKQVRTEHTGEKSTLAQLNAELRNVPNAWHYAFMDTPAMAIASEDGDLAADPPGFDRAAFLARLGAELCDFFDEVLR